MDWVTITTDSEDETQALGARIAAVLPLGRVVALHGDLGAGKTVLSRGLARGFGITEPVTSPTFTVVQEYERPGGSWLFHLDMYRIECDDDALAFGI
ncbi:MAG: tRNA (adenosine(37)-N6)-threonylcarbamoyltransferase complex ATPase subunit type 1 TsaE, partial [Lentisphaerae bacterium]|nr:tRNA (adenosine(37)-N6)-threonylcarbamoyltransferase complex ATPase subunit type 1 TsaE [Lentisphaerota bacterium]